jgi:nucleotide-binding universal stress UspA family protein
MHTATIDRMEQAGIGCQLKKIVVAYDASPAAERALHDAINLGMRFSAELLLVQVDPPQPEPTTNYTAVRDERASEFKDLGAISSRLINAGIRCRGILRAGIVGDTLFNICCEENADLLLLGAYGYGVRDRQTLGSTAEFLLRAIPCPTLTYGPGVARTFDDSVQKGPILVPISLPCEQDELRSALAISKLFDAALELLHVAYRVSARHIRDLEYQCEQICDRLRAGGVSARWSLYCGSPEILIPGRATEIDSPFVLMPLKWKDRLSSVTSDHVAAHVIRAASVPVMTYRVA